MSNPFEELSALDRRLHEPARLAILTALTACRSCDFVYLQALTQLTKGNLSNHLQKLEQAGLVELVKTHRGRVPRTMVSLTPTGRDAVERHWERLTTLRRQAASFTPAIQEF